VCGYHATRPYVYDVVGVILEDLKKVGSDRKAIVNYIANPDFECNGVIGLTKLYEDGQSVTGGLTLNVSRDGKWVPWSE